MKILVIQNTPAIKNMLLETLSQKEYELTFSTDSNDALRLIKKRKDIRIVIAELSMPGMNGIELCKQIRSVEFPYYIYIILMTSKNYKSELIAGIKEGADDILTIPINPDELQIRVLVGERIVHLEEDLIEKNNKLRMANEILRGNLVSGQEAQKNLLPSCFPVISNMEFAASFIPSAFGSGDIYNIFRLDETNIGLYNIDVSGHGVSAALFNDAFSPKIGKRYGLERARQILTEHYPESLERSFDRLISDVQEFMGQDGFSDDISIIGFKWLGSRVK